MKNESCGINQEFLKWGWSIFVAVVILIYFGSLLILWSWKSTEENRSSIATAGGLRPNQLTLNLLCRVAARGRGSEDVLC